MGGVTLPELSQCAAALRLSEDYASAMNSRQRRELRRLRALLRGIYPYVDIPTDTALEDELQREVLPLPALAIGRVYRERHGPAATTDQPTLSLCPRES